MEKLLRLSLALPAFAVRKSAFYEGVKAGLFTRPIKISTRAVALPESEVGAINAARVAGKSPDEIRQLVRELHAKRVAPSSGTGTSK